MECINPGEPVERWPTFYIEPSTSIDCGACVPECPYSAIFPEEDVPTAFQAAGEEFLNRPGLAGQYTSMNHRGEPVVLGTTRVLAAGETVDLTPSIAENHAYYK